MTDELSKYQLCRQIFSTYQKYWHISKLAKLYLTKKCRAMFCSIEQILETFWRLSLQLSSIVPPRLCRNKGVDFLLLKHHTQWWNIVAIKITWSQLFHILDQTNFWLLTMTLIYLLKYIFFVTNCITLPQTSKGHLKSWGLKG